MDYKELNQILVDFDQAMFTLEETYIENEGECTEQTEAMEAEISGLKELLTTEGIDLLGRWLKAKEDKKKSLKAERDYITRQMAATDNCIEFIKDKIAQVMSKTGQDKIKGDKGYSFAAIITTKTDVNKDVLKSAYTQIVENAIREKGVPAYIGFSLTASSTKAAEIGVQDGDESIFETTTKPSVRFTKPRVSKEA